MQPPYYPSPPPGYQAPPPRAPKKGMPAFLIVLVVFGCLFMALFVVAAVMGFARTMGAKTPDPASAVLSQSYATGNGLLTAHYPADFAAKTLDDATLVISRNFTGGEDEVVTLAAVKNPITNDVREFARLLDGLVEKNVIAKGGTYSQTSHHATKCFKGHPGWELEMTFKLSTVGPYVSRGCFFLDGNKGYELRYDVPASRADQEVVLLQRIIAATVLTP